MTPQLYMLYDRGEVDGSVGLVKEEPLPGTNGQTTIPVPATISVKLHVEGNIKRWPRWFEGDIGRFQFYAKSLAEEILNAGLTGIEFHPVQLAFGNLRKLAGKEAECPEYLWARITGILYADASYRGKPLKTDETGLFLIEKPPPGCTATWESREEQPKMLDFNRIVPGNRNRIILSQKAADFLRGRLDQEMECAVAATYRNRI